VKLRARDVDKQSKRKESCCLPPYSRIECPVKLATTARGSNCPSDSDFNCAKLGPKSRTDWRADEIRRFM
jgi:hypothetical protein